MKQAITGLRVMVEITEYNEAGQVSARPTEPPVFVALEADIPESVMEWVKQRIMPKEARNG